MLKQEECIQALCKNQSSSVRYVGWVGCCRIGWDGMDLGSKFDLIKYCVKTRKDQLIREDITYAN